MQGVIGYERERKIHHVVLHLVGLEQFSNDCRKTKTKVGNHFDQSQQEQTAP